jgi:hypothetical protein
MKATPLEVRIWIFQFPERGEYGKNEENVNHGCLGIRKGARAEVQRWRSACATAIYVAEGTFLLIH